MKGEFWKAGLKRPVLLAPDGTELYPLRHKDGKWKGLAVFCGQVMATGPSCDTEDEAWASCEQLLANQQILRPLRRRITEAD